MNTRFSLVSTLLVLSVLLALALAGCQSAGAPEESAAVAPTVVAPTQPAAVETATPAPEPTAETAAPAEPTAPADLAAILGNLSYPGIFPDSAIALTDGYATYDDGGSGTPFIKLHETPILSGDLDGDGTEDAVALLRDESTGSGNFTYLVAVTDVTGNPTPADALMIGDRIEVKALALDGDTITVDMITQGPGDAACCASWNGRQVIAFADGRLVAGEVELGESVSLAELDGTSWRLVDLSEGEEPALSEVAVTVQFNGDQISGNAGCNNFTGTITAEGTLAQEIAISPLAVTSKMCAEPVMAQETVFLSHLQNSAGWWYNVGDLSLTYVVGDNAYSYMTLVPATGEQATNEDGAMQTTSDKPAYVSDLEAAYGAPSQEAFGSAVFFEQLAASDSLETAALDKYKYYVGDLWDQYGEDAWMEPWKLVYSRPAGQTPDIAAELNGIEDFGAKLSTEMILTNIENADAAQQALSAAFDDASVTELVVYTLGDSGAMSGLEIAGRRANGETTFLVFLMD